MTDPQGPDPIPQSPEPEYTPDRAPDEMPPLDPTPQPPGDGTPYDAG